MELVHIWYFNTYINLKIVKFNESINVLNCFNHIENIIWKWEQFKSVYVFHHPNALLLLVLFLALLLSMNFLAYSLSWCDILCLSSISNVGKANKTLCL